MMILCLGIVDTEAEVAFAPVEQRKYLSSCAELLAGAGRRECVRTALRYVFFGLIVPGGGGARIFPSPGGARRA